MIATDMQSGMEAIQAETHQVGGMSAYCWDNDPKRLGFVCARYKFAARMLEGLGRVLEVGCADGFGSRIVRQHVGDLTAVDIDPRALAQARGRMCARWQVRFEVHDILAAPLPGFDAVYCLDVFEHISPESEQRFLAHLRASAPVAIIGTPSIESQIYASAPSKAGHVNCVSKTGLRERMHRHYSHVFMLGMNDETLHCGFDGMTHYLFGIGAG